MKFKPLSLFLFLWAGASLAACLPSPRPDRLRGYLVVALESHPTHLDPRYATDADSVRVAALVFNSLLRPDAHSRFQPELAENWQLVDTTTYLFRLRKNVTFHDGRPLTAEDVRYTYESALD
ncbi:MAG: ABC transporter substrate-binding protein, partial [Deltaproteobacteria bacterium]|nr:ABC transporter substrate-binding protein [Deltaproteobacteria bacterium]